MIVKSTDVEYKLRHYTKYHLAFCPESDWSVDQFLQKAVESSGEVQAVGSRPERQIRILELPLCLNTFLSKITRPPQP